VDGWLYSQENVLSLLHDYNKKRQTSINQKHITMTTEDLLMEIQDCDELLYTSQEANLMLEYRDAVKRLNTESGQEETCSKLMKDFESLSSLIKEFEDRVHLTANNLVEPTKAEILDLKKLFDKIENMDFSTSEEYEKLMGNAQA